MADPNHQIRDMESPTGGFNGRGMGGMSGGMGGMAEAWGAWAAGCVDRAPGWSDRP